MAKWKNALRSSLTSTITHVIIICSMIQSSVTITKNVSEIERSLCHEMISHFDTPCLCNRIHTSAFQNLSQEGHVMHDNNDGVIDDQGTHYYIIDCDYVSLAGSFPVIPYGLPVDGYSHRYGSFQTVEGRLFTSSEIPLRWIDLSHNHLQRLTNTMFEGVETTLEEVYLGHNYLGHQLNPVFATEEFNSLSQLKILDLSHNMLKALDDSLFKGLSQLQELYLSDNYFDTVAKSSLMVLQSLKFLGLQNNHIGKAMSIKPIHFQVPKTTSPYNHDLFYRSQGNLGITIFQDWLH